MASWKWIVGALAAALWLAPVAAEEQGTTGQAEGTKGQAERTTGQAEGTKATAGKKLVNADIRALSKLHAVNGAEIEAGTWMKDHATNDKVKDFAGKMVDDHKALDDDLMKFAQNSGTDLASAHHPADAKHARELKQLKTMTGTRADRDYMRMMVEGHRQALKDTRDAQRSARNRGNAELASLFENAAKKIDEHLEDARDIQKDIAQRQARMPKR